MSETSETKSIPTFIVASEPRINENIMQMYYIMENKDNTIEKLEASHFTIDETLYGSMDEADQAMKKECHTNTVNYTLSLKNETPLLSDLDKLHSRHVYVYVGDDLTTTPGIYHIPIYQYLFLKPYCNLLRLARPEEMDGFGENIKSFIPVSENVNKWIKTFSIEIQQNFILENDPIANIDINNLYTCMYQIIYNQNLEETDKKKLLQDIYPDVSDEEISALFNMISQIKDTAQEYKDQGKSLDDFQNNLINEFNNMVGFQPEDQVQTANMALND